jgi:hypothetical protein
LSPWRLLRADDLGHAEDYAGTRLVVAMKGHIRKFTCGS